MPRRASHPKPPRGSKDQGERILPTIVETMQTEHGDESLEDDNGQLNRELDATHLHSLESDDDSLYESAEDDYRYCEHDQSEAGPSKPISGEDPECSRSGSQGKKRSNSVSYGSNGPTSRYSSPSEATKKLVMKREDGLCWLCGKYGSDVAHIMAKKDNILEYGYRSQNLLAVTGLNDYRNLMLLCPGCHQRFDERVPIWIFLPNNLDDLIDEEKKFHHNRLEAAQRGIHLQREPRTEPISMDYTRYMLRDNFISSKPFITNPVRSWDGDPMTTILRSQSAISGLRVLSPRRGGIPHEVMPKYAEFLLLLSEPPPAPLPQSHGPDAPDDPPESDSGGPPEGEERSGKDDSSDRAANDRAAKRRKTGSNASSMSSKARGKRKAGSSNKENAVAFQGEEEVDLHPESKAAPMPQSPCSRDIHGRSQRATRPTFQQYWQRKVEDSTSGDYDPSEWTIGPERCAEDMIGWWRLARHS